MNPFCVFALLLLCASPTTAQIISELHATPSGGEPEWIEIYNPTSSVISLDRFYICDARSCVQLPKCTIDPHDYLVITNDAEALEESRGIRSSIEASLPSLNNSTDVIELRTRDSSLIDRIEYNMKDHVKGRSIERIGTRVDNVVIMDTVWSASLSNDSATCGYMNSTIVLYHDLRVMSITAEDASVSISVVNHGQRASTSKRLRITTQQAQLVTDVPGLRPQDVHTWTVPLADLKWPSVHGAVDLVAEIDIRDDRSSNDRLTALLIFPPPKGAVSINEIMFDPWPEMSDYVELVNTGTDTVDLTGWIIEDEAGDRSIVSSLLQLPPDSCCVVANHDRLLTTSVSSNVGTLKPTLTLNASGDRVVVRTPSGFLVDDVTFDADWHNEMLPDGKGVSLEKLSPALASASRTSWTSSGALAGGTPAQQNSTIRLVDFSTSMTAEPSPFSPERTHPRHPCIITYRQPFQQAIASLHIRRLDGSMVTTLLNSTFTGAEAAVAWDGTAADGSRVPPGAYLAVFESVDASSTRTHRAACAVIVGE